MSIKSFIKNELWVYALTFALGCFYALSYYLFIVPNDFAPSGINGIAVMIQYLGHFSIGYMSLLINVPLCVFAFFCIDRHFACKTATFSLSFSGAYLLFQNVPAVSSVLDSFQYVALKDGSIVSDTIYPVMISGLICGLCFGVLFKCNSSTGGTDIISKYLSKKYPQLNFFFVTFVINSVIAVASYFVYGKPNDQGVMEYDYRPVCMCLMYCFISSFTGNRILAGSKLAYKFTIITDYAEDIEKEIIDKLHHGVTRLHGQGGYSHKNKEMIICLVNTAQLVDFENIIKKYPDTFSFVENVNQTFGKFNYSKMQNVINYKAPEQKK
ncbi:MAG: YitT family protein [Candidatus Neoclostridium sp.]